MHARLVILILLALLSPITAHAAQRPNILIFHVDDMGWAQPGCYGGKTAISQYPPPVKNQQADPQENVNIANDPKNAQLVATLTEQWLKGWKGAKAANQTKPQP
ncbi:MAG: hypothetical protein ABMA01_18730 [Chthoniobacteraceae bacterium]